LLTSYLLGTYSISYFYIFFYILKTHYSITDSITTPLSFSFPLYRNEQGEFYGLDLGGTNLRVLWVRLGSDKGTIEARDESEWPIPEECYDSDNGRLLEWVAERAEEVMNRHRPNQDDAINNANNDTNANKFKPVIGFCFSFACEQTSLGDGKLLLWTKSFRGTGLIGNDVVSVLKSAFNARGIDAQIPALMNDTVATLIAMKYAEPSTQVGIILGTGTNCAYLEKTECIAKLPPPIKKSAHGPSMVINTEWGDLDNAGNTLPRCEEDLWVDFSSANPGHGLFEKLIAGLYMGEVARRIMLKLAENGGLFDGCRPSGRILGSLLATEGSFGSASLAAVDQDASENLETTAMILKNAFGFKKMPSKRECEVAKEVCGLVSKRSARLCAAAVAAIVERCSNDTTTSAAATATDNNSVEEGEPAPFVIAVDGSVFSKYPGYQVKLKDALVELLGSARAEAVQLRLVDGGSVAGAAYLAAAAINEK
jgi:hexokinase